MIQRIRIDMNELRASVSSKERLEALAFCVLIKLNFVNSEMYGATSRRMCEFFGMGATKLTRCVRNAIRFGYIKREGGSIIANRLRGESGYEYFMMQEFYTFSFNETGKSVYRIKNIEDTLRKAVLLNHIKMQNQSCETHCTADSDNAYNRKEMRRIRRRKNCLYKNYANEKLGINRIKSVVSTGRNKAIRLKNELVRSGEISQQVNCVPVISFNDNDRLFHNKPDAMSFYAKAISNGECPKSNGYVFVCSDGVMRRTCNSYTYTSNTIHRYSGKYVH